MTTKIVEPPDPERQEFLALVLAFVRAGAVGFYVDREIAEAPTYAPARRRAIVSALADLILADLERRPA